MKRIVLVLEDDPGRTWFRSGLPNDHVEVIANPRAFVERALAEPAPTALFLDCDLGHFEYESDGHPPLHSQAKSRAEHVMVGGLVVPRHIDPDSEVMYELNGFDVVLALRERWPAGRAAPSCVVHSEASHSGPRSMVTVLESMGWPVRRVPYSRLPTTLDAACRTVPPRGMADEPKTIDRAHIRSVAVLPDGSMGVSGYASAAGREHVAFARDVEENVEPAQEPATSSTRSMLAPMTGDTSPQEATDPWPQGPFEPLKAEEIANLFSPMIPPQYIPSAVRRDYRGSVDSSSAGGPATHSDGKPMGSYESALMKVWRDGIGRDPSSLETEAALAMVRICLSRGVSVGAAPWDEEASRLFWRGDQPPAPRDLVTRKMWVDGAERTVVVDGRTGGVSPFDHSVGQDREPDGDTSAGGPRHRAIRPRHEEEVHHGDVMDGGSFWEDRKRADDARRAAMTSYERAEDDRRSEAAVAPMREALKHAASLIKGAMPSPIGSVGQPRAGLGYPATSSPRAEASAADAAPRADQRPVELAGWMAVKVLKAATAVGLPLNVEGQVTLAMYCREGRVEREVMASGGRITEVGDIKCYPGAVDRDSDAGSE